jgi:hypothetical protein
MNIEEKGRSWTQPLVAVAAVGLLAAALFELGSRRGGTGMERKGGFRESAALASDCIRESLGSAGFGVARGDAIRKASGPDTDTLTVFPEGDGRPELFFVDGERHSLVHIVEDRRMVIAPEMREFRLQLRDQYGAVTADPGNARAVTFSLAGLGKETAQMTVAATALAKNGAAPPRRFR